MKQTVFRLVALFVVLAFTVTAFALAEGVSSTSVDAPVSEVEADLTGFDSAYSGEIAPKKVAFSNGKSITIGINEGIVLNPVLSPEGAETTYTWKSSKTSVAKVDKYGMVIGKKIGTAKITVTTANKKKATITVKVIDPSKPDTIAIDEGKKLTMAIGDKLQLNYTISPATATSKVTWSSSNKKVATVDKKTGLVTAKKKGTASITVTTANKKKAKIKITVKKATVKPTDKPIVTVTPEPQVTVAPTLEPVVTATPAPTATPVAPTIAPTEEPGVKVLYDIERIMNKTVAEANSIIPDRLLYYGDGYYVSDYLLVGTEYINGKYVITSAAVRQKGPYGLMGFTIGSNFAGLRLMLEMTLFVPIDVRTNQVTYSYKNLRSIFVTVDYIDNTVTGIAMGIFFK